MRTVRQLPNDIPKETDLDKFPDSTVKNETDTMPGTPVVREIYGDPLTNWYKIMRLVGIEPNGLEDNELNGYQLVNALKKFTNIQNDVEQILGLAGTVFTLPLNFTFLPNKYFCFARASESYTSSTSYTIKGDGTGGEEYNFSCADGFASGDVLLVILDQAGSRAYNISAGSASVNNASEMFTPFGTPLAYSDDTTKIWYQSEGILFSDKPEAYDLQSAVRTTTGDGTLLVYEMFLINSFVVCVCYSNAVQTYTFYKFALTDFNAPILMNISGGSFPTGVDRKPNVYTNGTTVAITNSTGNSANNYAIDLYTVDVLAGTLTATGSISLDASFEKTTNAVLHQNRIYTLVAGTLVQYNLGSGVRTFTGSYPTFIGVLFKIKENVWYSNGEVAKKWTLQIL